MTKPIRSFGAVLGALLVSACDPAFETTADLCASGQNSAVIVGLDFSDPNVSPYTVVATRDSGSYMLYLQDILEAAEPDAGVTLSADEQAAMDTIKGFINDEDKFNLAYEQAAGVVTQATNPLDFIESLIASTDDAVVIGAFEAAKNQIAAGISTDDGFCIYRNNNIRFVDENADDKLFAEMSLTYDPFTSIVQQNIIMTEVLDELNDANERATAPYIGFYQANASDFVSQGYSATILRQAILNNSDGTQSLVLDDGNDNDLGQAELSTINSFCLDSEDAVTTCPGGTVTRAPVKSQCDGSDPDGTDETGQNQERTIDLNGSLTGLKRIRLETDFSQTPPLVRVYASDYNEAIYDSDGTTVLKDPTNCEKQAVLDELAAASPGEGVRLTIVEDPNYDVRRDEDNNVIEPTPAYSFNGTTIPSRQP